MNPRTLLYTRAELDDAVEQLGAVAELFRVLTTLDAGERNIAILQFRPWATRAVEAHAVVLEVCSALSHHGFEDATGIARVQFFKEPHADPSSGESEPRQFVERATTDAHVPHVCGIERAVKLTETSAR